MYCIIHVFCGSFAAFSFSMGILRIYINSFKGLSKEAWMLAVVMLINRSGSMVLPFLGVYMTDHLHFGLFGALGTAVSYSMLIIDHNIWLILVSITVLSLAEILVLPFMSAITAVRSGRGNKGSYMGLNGMAVAISFIITPFLGTRIASDFGFSVLWAGTGVVLLAVAIALYISVRKMMPGRGH
ncbi:MFS transporter [Niabella aurantiaca]|uniref:MFS transporter n=1 Tax=Niabella aurantiaca TaxID=379900 RepID=UPI0003812542|nr:MFS transporter [Niabella aurantiaca]